MTQESMIPGDGKENGPCDRKVAPKAAHMPWFHGKISREVAEKILVPRKDGLFLVRESTNFPGDYTLCVCFDNRVEHYRHTINILYIGDV